MADRLCKWHGSLLNVSFPELGHNVSKCHDRVSDATDILFDELHGSQECKSMVNTWPFSRVDVGIYKRRMSWQNKTTKMYRGHPTEVMSTSYPFPYTA